MADSPSASPSEAPFGTDGEWLRCQLHAHTTNSDGEATPDELTALYAAAGCDVLAITDHYHVTHAEREGLIVIPSSELTARVGTASEADVLALGAEALPAEKDYLPSVEDAAAWIVANGGVAYLAHPYWSGIGPEVYLSAPSLSGIEVMNAGSEVLQGNGLSAVHWDDILTRGATCLGIATDDCHYPGRDSALAWTVVRVRERTRAAVLAALRDGAFYSTTGVEIHDVARDGDGVIVRCAPARTVTLRSGPWDGCRTTSTPGGMSWRGAVLETDGDGAIVAARLEAPEFGAYGRVEVAGVDGTTAWANPLAFPR